MAEEIEFKKATSKNRMIAVGGIVAAIVVLIIVFWAGGGSNVTEYSLGSPCKNDCGRFELDGWVCLSDVKYCTYPCGDIRRACPDGYECKEVTGAPAVTETESGEKKAMYCIKK